MKKIWRIRKRLIAGCLVVVLVLSMIFVPTKKAYAIVGFDDAAFILAMMAAAGIGFVGYNAYNGSNLAEDLWDELGSLEDDISDAYDKAVFTVLQGGGGGSDPNDFDPDNDDPEKKPTTWAKLKEWWKKHPNKALSMAATGSTIGYIMNVFGDNLNEKALQGQVVSDVLEIPQEVLSTMMSQIQAYPYFIIFYSGSDLERIVMASDYLYVSILRPTGASFVGSYCISNWYRIDKTLVPIGTLSSGIPLYTDEVEIIDATFNQGSMMGLRDFCIVHLMLDAGFRSQEVINLKIQDVLFDKDALLVVNSKGSVSRIVIMCSRLKQKLQDYIYYYRLGSAPDDNVFVQIKSKELINENVIKQYFARLKKRTGINRLHPHLLRHTFATSYILGGGNLEMLRILLGHSDYDVTKNYLHLANQYQILHANIYKLDPVFFQQHY